MPKAAASRIVSRRTVRVLRGLSARSCRMLKLMRSKRTTYLQEDKAGKQRVLGRGKKNRRVWQHACCKLGCLGNLVAGVSGF